MEDITPADSVVPVYLVPMTEEELAERQQWVREAEQREKEEQDSIAAKESAMIKLAALGLTDDEIKAIIGGV